VRVCVVCVVCVCVCMCEQTHNIGCELPSLNPSITLNSNHNLKFCTKILHEIFFPTVADGVETNGPLSIDQPVTSPSS
jgi:hypothetical protein